MAEFSYTNSSTTTMDSSVDDFSVQHQNLDVSFTGKEIYWDFTDASEQLGYYKSIPELKKSVDKLSVWVAGKGFTCDAKTEDALSLITGQGNDNFQSIMQNLLAQKKIFGDAFAHIVRDKDTEAMINLKPLYTGDMRIVQNDKGITIRYEQRTRNPNGKVQTFEPHEIFHISNERVGNEIHGTSVIEVCKWVIDARNEAMADWRRILHRSTIRVLYVDSENGTQLSTLKTQYAEAINKGELLVLPGKPSEAGFQDLTAPPAEQFLRWIEYLENFFYQAVGIPRVIASSREYSEASSKVGFLTFEPDYTNEQTLLETDLWIQLGVELIFNRPPSLSGMLQSSENKNTGQTGFQPNEIQTSVVKNE
jgi:hypothetical protein